MTHALYQSSGFMVLDLLCKPKPCREHREYNVMIAGNSALSAQKRISSEKKSEQKKLNREILAISTEIESFQGDKNQW